MITFDSDQQTGQLPYCGRHRKVPLPLRTALWLGRRVSHAGRVRAGTESYGSEPAEAVARDR